MTVLDQFDYADLVGDDYPNTRWTEQSEKYARYERYFNGEIFEETFQHKKADRSTELPKLYPLQVNLVKMMVLTHCMMFMGQWEDQVMEFSVEPRRRGARLDEWANQAKQFAEAVWLESDLNSLFMEQALACMLYGGSVFKVISDPTYYTRVRTEAIMPVYFLPRWHPMQPSTLLEVYVVFTMTCADAKLAYGFTPETSVDGDTAVLYVEYWNRDRYEVSIDGQVMQRFSGPNPYGFIPFVYIPRIRTPGDFYGLAVAEDIMGVQDELNMRLADVGDRINYAAHPVWVLKNYKGKKTEWAVGPDEVINLGSTVGGDEPSLDIVRPPGEPASTFKYLDFCLDLAKRGAMAPPIAFGEDQGSQRSALTLNFRMWPLMQQAKWARANWSAGLTRLHDMMVRIRIIKDGLEKRQGDDCMGPGCLGHRIAPKWAPILPRDRAAEVEEVLSAWSQGQKPLVSLGAAVETLGLTDNKEEEIQQILSLWQRLAELEQQEPAPPG